MKERQSYKGQKRKRPDNFNEKDLNAKLVGKLHHDLKEVRKAAKRAKTFEMQKLVKKLKGLRVKSSSELDITECESQLEQLKEISHEAVANTALKTKLSKDKDLSNNEPIQAAMSRELKTNFLLPAKGATPAAKVQSRLLSSKILAAEIASALEDLRLVLHSTDSMAGGDSEDDLASGERPRKMKRMSSQDDGEDDVPMDVVDADTPDLAEVDEEVDDDNPGWESGTIGDDEKEPDDEWESNSLVTDDAGALMDEDGSESDHVISEWQAGQSSKITESTFLPTLSTGFIRGDSSDWSDSEASAADVGVKKNRRGQRARRAIWEKKYGSNANHKKKEAAEMNERGRKRWSQATHGDRRGASVSKLKNERPNKYQAPSDANAHEPRSVPIAPTNSNYKPLHPSWEAKKKQKEKMNVIVPPPPGRKIKFS
ncbi:Bud-site selection protein [Marasmius fiardii PR-910]|nr:Bud-site selection protein [Marasmius fiardii PR-910]